jgi:hypothetical protein
MATISVSVRLKGVHRPVRCRSLWPTESGVWSGGICVGQLGEGTPGAWAEQLGKWDLGDGTRVMGLGW